MPSGAGFAATRTGKLAEMNNSMPMQRKRSERKKRSLMLPLIALAMLAFLTSCAQGVSENCPAIATYSDVEEAQVDHDLALLPPDSLIRDFIKDYGVLRNEVRACRNVPDG